MSCFTTVYHVTEVTISYLQSVNTNEKNYAISKTSLEGMVTNPES